MLLSVIFLIAGFTLLIKGADFFVQGASSLAKRLKVSDIAIGLTVVAFGTSAPELIVNLFAALRGATDLSLGNIIGSNIANLLFILGVSALIVPLTVKKNTTWKEIPFALLAVMLVWVLANDVLLDQVPVMQISRSEGLTLIAFFLIFLYYTFGIVRAEGESETVTQRSWPRMTALIVVGLAGLVLGGHWTVTGAVNIARILGLSEALIGLTVVAVGTSLPELATSIVAAVRGKMDIAVGNVVGSNIFNIFWILGVTAIIRPLPFAPSLQFDLGVLLSASFMLFLFMFIGKRHVLERWQGGAFVGLYIFYIVFVAARG